MLPLKYLIHKPRFPKIVEQTVEAVSKYFGHKIQLGEDKQNAKIQNKKRQLCCIQKSQVHPDPD